ncbi:MAG: thioredoxin [Bacteroidota bacterium]
MPGVADSEKIVNLTDSDFQKQISKGVALVDFWASWCMPCKMMAPVLNEVANEAQEQVKICKLNIEENSRMASHYGVRSIPTILLFRNGKEVSRIVGVKSKEYLLQQLHNVKYK